MQKIGHSGKRKDAEGPVGIHLIQWLVQGSSEGGLGRAVAKIHKSYSEYI